MLAAGGYSMAFSLYLRRSELFAWGRSTRTCPYDECSTRPLDLSRVETGRQGPSPHRRRCKRGPLHGDPLDFAAPEHGQAHRRPYLAGQRPMHHFGRHAPHVAPVDEKDLVARHHARLGGRVTRRRFAYRDPPVAVRLRQDRADRTRIGRAAGQGKRQDQLRYEALHRT